MTAKTRRRWCPKDKRYVLAIEDQLGAASRFIWSAVTLGLSDVFLGLQGRTYLCLTCGAVTLTREPAQKGGFQRP
ncbi:MAG TPA: hypothetical protein VN329_07500 [Roseomonas sp.]|nr:hypothetical protein [Roseomonas sp.]